MLGLKYPQNSTRPFSYWTQIWYKYANRDPRGIAETTILVDYGQILGPKIEGLGLSANSKS